MFDYDSMIQRAIKFFPTWSDIRKRHTKSNGGKLLSSITEETVKIEDAIQEYIDYYFITKYEGKESTIIDYTYRTNIGIINNLSPLSVSYNDNTYNITTNIDLFNSNTNIVYYENGYLYIRKEIYNDEVNNILVIYDDNKLYYKLEKYHVWNIYDEFACFIGMERHEDETNEQLYNRMLYFNKNKPNGSELGLKHAIISELMIYEPDISEDDIIIEKVNETNLRKPYQDYNELLDKLNEMNRDVYRWKRWDLDEWIYDFKTLEYLSYKWDETLTKWQNGIGYDDDLKTIVSSAINSTDASITLYEKSQEKLLSYIHNNDIYKTINFNLKTYKDVLSSIPVNYKIQASPMTKINPEEFSINIYEDSYVNEKVSVESLYSIGNDVSKIDNSTITDIYPYRLQFVPKDGNYDIEIKKARVLYKKDGKVDHITDLLIPTSSFTINSLGYLVNTSTKKSIRNINKLNSYSGLINLDNSNGFTLSNGTAQGSGNVSINGFGGYSLNYEISCNMSELPKNNIQYNSADCEWINKNKQLSLLNNGRNKTVEIDIIANKLSFDIQCSNSVLVYLYNEDTDNWNPEEVIGPDANWTSEETKTPQRIRVKIESNSDDLIYLGNFQYSKYEIVFSTEKGIILEQDNNLILPNLIENNLYFKLSSYSGSNPIIKGIYIGENTEGLNYVTESFEYESGFTRVLEVESNCTVNLLKMNYVSSKTESIIYDYNTCTSYKATSDEAWIRLNLSQYDSIDEIYASNGSIELIEESGITYYNLKLTNGETATYVQIVGNKNIEKETLTLYDMILTYNPNFDISKDNVYCSRLANGLIIANNGENNSVSILQLDSSLFNGLDILKYEFNTIPDNLNIIWGTSDTEKDYGYIHSGDFEYISFFKADDQIHTALNSYKLFTNEVKNIKIVNNFNPSVDTSVLNYYTVEPYDNNNDNVSIDIRFYSELDEFISFDKLKTWSVGYKNLYIQCDLDFLNSIIYNVSESYVSDEVKLNQLVPINDKYNDNTIQTNKCVIECSEDMEIVYKTYDGTSDTEDLLVKEVIEIQEDGFKKLEYANIDRIMYIGTDMSGSANTKNQFTDYSLLNQEGIIVWNNVSNHIGKIIYIQYTIKQPIYFLLSDEFLYRTISYNINAYKEIARYNIKNMQSGESYNLNTLDKINESDLIYVSCTEPTFEANMTEDNKIIFNKFSTENNVLVKTGYYYINGKEYYLFSNDGTLELDTDDNMYSENIDIEDGKIITYKTTDNRLKNTAMIQKGINNLFNFNYTETLVKGISNFNKFTSCDSFYKWSTNGLTISLTNDYTNAGCNGLALMFSSIRDWGYSYIEITDYLYDDSISYISFISLGIKTYIGENTKFLDIELNEPLSIKIIDEISSNTNLKTYELNKKPDTKYYLIVQGDGVLDDIVITNNISDIYSCHNKNIDLLGIEINDKKTEGDIYRLEINSNDDLNSYCASICSDGLIRTTSKLDWNITKIKQYNTKEDWLTFELNNIKVNESFIESTDYLTGTMFTGEPIFIDNPYTVNRLIFKVNDIDLDNMSDIKIYIYTSNERNGQYRLYTSLDNNFGFVYGDYLSRYIKVKLEVPKNKVITSFSVFAEYKSDKNNIIQAETCNTGYIVSNIFDTQECLKYKLNNVNIEQVSDSSDIKMYIRAAKEDISVWTDWKEIDINNKTNNIVFNNARYFQIKIQLYSKYAYVKFNNIDLEVL